MQEIEHKKGKIYYTMGEVAEMFDVNASLLRYWEQEFDILKPHRNKKGNRLFTPKDVDNIRIIYHLLKERKMKIEVARKYIKDHRKEVDRDAEITERLMSIRALLLEIKQDLAYGGEIIDEEEELPHPVTTASVPRTGEAGNGQPRIQQTTRDTTEITPQNSSADPAYALPIQEEAASNTKPPFEEQVLFDIAVPLEMTQCTPAGQDEGFESAKAAFQGETAHQEETQEEKFPVSDAIEQTLF